MKTKMLFGTVGSPTSTPKKPGGSVGSIIELRRLGLDALELGWVQSVRVTESKCQEINMVSKENSIFISVHAPYYINLNATDSEWVNSRKRLVDAAHYGWLAGATDIIFHPGSYFENQPSQVLKIAIPRLKDVVSELRDGNNSVILRPETMGKQSMLGSLEDTLIMSQEINGVLPCLDFAHLHARPGNGSVNSETEWQSIIDSYVHFLGKNSLSNLHIHLSGIEYSSKGERNHLPILESDLNIQLLFQVLKTNHCTGRILCESPILEKDALFMQSLWNEI